MEIRFNESRLQNKTIICLHEINFDESLKSISRTLSLFGLTFPFNLFLTYSGISFARQNETNTLFYSVNEVHSIGTRNE